MLCTCPVCTSDAILSTPLPPSLHTRHDKAREAAFEEWAGMSKEDKQPYSDKRKEVAEQYKGACDACRPALCGECACMHA